jgi:hypothetical protein
MTKTYAAPLPSGQAWPRPYLIRILDAALEAKETRFTRQTALAWLASYPGDLPIKLLHAKALVSEGLERQALPILHNLTQVDPEYEDAQALLYQLSQKPGGTSDDVAHDCALALGCIPHNQQAKGSRIGNWGKVLAETRSKLADGDIPKAEENIQSVLGVASHAPLSGVTHLLVMRAQENTPRRSLLDLAEHYHQRWPDCLQFMLILAELLMEGGESVRGVALLHKVASKDVTGQVATRLWGTDHSYKNLWPKHLTALISAQIPSSVAAHMGWNLLPIPKMPLDPAAVTTLSKSKLPGVSKPTQGIDAQPLVDQQAAASSPETPTSVESELESEQENRKRSNSDGRFPVYVIFTTQKGLHRKFGVETTTILDEAMRKLVTSLRKRLDWGATLVYADDPASMAQYGLKPVPAEDPWKLKLALVDLDDALGKRGARIGAVLIIGGPDVVPFHYLPNPTDDNDADVPSDNPYATRDENYFIPEWPVGRLPCGSGKDPGLLLSILRAMGTHHATAKTASQNRLGALVQWFRSLFQARQRLGRASFGYSAEVWKDVSRSIYKAIGDPKALITSPPNEIHRKKMMPKTRLGYFNLHGVPDSPEWFGQRDTRNSVSGPDYPVALHPKDVINGGGAPKVIFSEACYGAHILKKSVDEALALKFLASGSQAVIGSTVISYGSVKAPLNAADLLGEAFWKFFKEGFPTGEALRRAKITLASEMHERQGYLDGEDQKTLISFVLFGDPLTQETNLKNWKIHKTLAKVMPPKEIKTICDRVDVPGTSEPIPKEVIGYVKNVVEQYLPGMRDAQLSLSHEHAECCCDGHVCPTSQLGTKTRPEVDPGRRVVTLSKQMVRARHVHETFARVTLDKEGKVVKLTVSR